MQEMAEKTWHKFDIEMMKWSANLGVFFAIFLDFYHFNTAKNENLVFICKIVSLRFHYIRRMLNNGDLWWLTHTSNQHVGLADITASVLS